MKNLSPKYQIWIDARKKFHLSHAHIQMARELGMNPKKFGKIANSKQEKWKVPLPQFIERMYFKRFNKKEPSVVKSIEGMVKDKKKKKEIRKEEHIIQSGPLKGKKISFASTTGIKKYSETCENFMKKIFDFEPGEYLITDESSLYDFTGVDDMELVDIQTKIKDVYDLDVSDIKSGNLLEIFMRIDQKKIKLS